MAYHYETPVEVLLTPLPVFAVIAGLSQVHSSKMIQLPSAK